MTRDDLILWADARNTSVEIARVIKDAARNRLDGDDLRLEDAMQMLWESPTKEEVQLILEGAWSEAGDCTLYWGDTTFRRVRPSTVEPAARGI